jgi:hypothetical protein
MQDAWDLAIDGDTVLVADGIYDTGGRVVGDSALKRVAVIKAVTVQSLHGPQTACISSMPDTDVQTMRGVWLAAGARLEGFTVSGGRVDGNGGGVLGVDVSSVLSNCVLSGNTVSGCGGGAYGCALQNCLVISNSAVTGSIFWYGTWYWSCLPARGGGVAACSLRGCFLTGNTVSGENWEESGGGAWSSTLIGCSLDGNAAMHGGGASACALTNCLVVRNQDNFMGGGAESCDLQSCIVTLNRSALAGAGIYLSSACNSIIWGNLCTNPFDITTDDGYDSVMSVCCTTFPLPGDGNIAADPLFVGDDDFHLRPDSPCINAGVNQDWMAGATDLDGNPRIRYGVSDMGAYECFGFAEALDCHNLAWSTGGDAFWFPETAVASDGASAAQSGPLGDNAATWLQTAVGSSGTLAFRWRVSSEARLDTLTLYVNGAVYRSITGATDWQSVSLFVPPGSNTFQWVYRKGKSGAAGDDCGWLDHVNWTPGVPGATWTLTVASTNGYGAPAPDMGAHVCTNGAVVTASVTSPWTIVADAEQAVCTGWTRTGIVPDAGAGTSVASVMTTDATLTWLWHTQYWLGGATRGGGFLDGANDWRDAGASIALTATPDAGWRFDHWEGDLDGATLQGNVVTITMDRARHVAAVFVVLDLAEALDTTNLFWTTGGDASWVPETDLTWDGSDAAVSGAVPDMGASWLQTEVVGPGTLAFHWRCDSETNCDYLVLLVDGEVWSWLTGDSGWQVATFDLGAGLHTLCWAYWKDESDAAGADAGWVDSVAWTGRIPTGFADWAMRQCLDGQPEAWFDQMDTEHGIAHGFRYAFGTNWCDGLPLLQVKVVNGHPVVETPSQDPDTRPFVRLTVEGTRDLNASDGWTWPMTPAAATNGKPDNCDWYEPSVAVSNAFFRLRGTLLP